MFGRQEPLQTGQSRCKSTGFSGMGAAIVYICTVEVRNLRRKKRRQEHGVDEGGEDGWCLHGGAQAMGKAR